MTNEIIGRPQGRRFGEPFSPLKTPEPPTKPADAQSVANAAYRIYGRITGKGNSEIREHVHDTYGASVYDWWKVRRFGGNAAEYLAYVSRDAVIWACELAAKKRRIAWPDAVAMAGDAPDTMNSEDPKRDIAAWVETLDYIIAQGELKPGAPPETYEAMRAQHRAKLQEKYAEQKEKAEVTIKQEKPKSAALDAAKKTATLKTQIEPAVAQLNAAIAELEAKQDFNDTPAEGTDAKTGEIVPVEPGPGLDYFGNPVKVDPIETNRTATIAYFAALYNIDPENIETIVRGLNKAFGDPWHKEADKLSMAEIEQKLNDFHKAKPRNSERAPEPAAKPSEPAAKVDEPQSKAIVENKPQDGVKKGNLEIVNNNALAPITTALPEVAKWEIMRQQADILIKSGFISHIKTPEQAIAIIMMGEALGIAPIVALTNLNIIGGKVTVPPQLMLGLIRRTKQLEDLQVSDDGQTCTVVMKRKGETAHTEKFSQENAVAMQLANKDNWRKQPAVMRKWRAIAAAARVVFPDAVWGMYLAEEMTPDEPFIEAA